MAMLLSADAAAMAVRTVSAAAFYKPAHGHIFGAIEALVARGKAIDAVTVTDELKRSGLGNAIDPSMFVSLPANTPSVANTPAFYAEIVNEHSRHRQVIAIGQRLVDAGYSGGAGRSGGGGRRRVLAEVLPGPAGPGPADLSTAGGSSSAEADVVPLWGDGEHVLWSSGELLLLCGPTGVGKTSIGQQLLPAPPGPARWTAARITGRRETAEGVVLYLAMDRPPQAARSLRRMVTEDQLDELDRRLKVWCAGRPSETSPSIPRTCSPWPNGSVQTPCSWTR